MQNKIFTNAAKRIIQTVKKPEIFLEFLDEAISGIHYWPVPRGRDTKRLTDFLCLNIRVVVLPWVKGVNVSSGLASGVDVMYNMFGPRGYMELLEETIFIMNFQIAEWDFSETKLQGVNSVISAMFTIQDALARQRQEEQKQEGASKTAAAVVL